VIAPQTGARADDMPDEWRVAVGPESTTMRLDRAATAAPLGVFVCAHGAGGHVADRGMERLTQTLCSRGLHVVRFNFLYRVNGSGRPDPMSRLTACLAAVAEQVRRVVDARPLLLGGRSMGGRAASVLAADGFDCDGLLLYAYPLHPAGKPEQLRDAHLPRIHVPVLCVNGTRDALCTPELMERALQPVTTDWTMHWLEGADHSFHVLKSSGRNDSQVMEEVADATAAWVKQHAGG
jgi:predicted alpha/beta-hydrolase family hydrolase